MDNNYEWEDITQELFNIRKGNFTCMRGRAEDDGAH